MLRSLLICAGLLSWGAAGSVSAAQKQPSSKQDEKRENEAVREAQRDVDDAKERLTKAESGARTAARAWKSALADRQAATVALQNVRERLEAEHETSTGLAAARQQLRESASELAKLSRPILESVHRQHAELVTQLAALHEALKQQDDPAARRDAAEKLPDLTVRLRELEREALKHDPVTSKLVEEVDRRERQVQNAVKKFESAVERDADLRAARQVFEKAGRDADAAEAAAAKSAAAVVDARTALQKAAARLQQKQMQDLRDPNRTPKKKSR